MTARTIIYFLFHGSLCFKCPIFTFSCSKIPNFWPASSYWL